MNFLQRLSSKPAASDAYGSVSTLEENATTSPQVDSFQDADNFKFGTGSSQTPAVVIKDRLKGSPLSADSLCDVPAASPSKIKGSTSIASSTGNLFSSWSAAGQNAIAAITKKDTTSTSKDSEPEPTEGKLMGEININWNYVTPAEPRTSDDAENGLSDAERLKQTKKVLEEEVRIGFCAAVMPTAEQLCRIGSSRLLQHHVTRILIEGSLFATWLYWQYTSSQNSARLCTCGLPAHVVFVCVSQLCWLV